MHVHKRLYAHNSFACFIFFVLVTSTFHLKLLPLLESFRCENGKPSLRCGSSLIAMTTTQTRQWLVLGLLPNLLRYSTSFPSSTSPHPQGAWVAAGERRWEHRVKREEEEGREEKKKEGKEGSSGVPILPRAALGKITPWFFVVSISRLPSEKF